MWKRAKKDALFHDILISVRKKRTAQENRGDEKMGTIQLKNVKKQFDKDVVIENLNLEIADGSFTVLVGPSGCGKSTTLRMITGLDDPTEGDIYIDGQKVNDITPGYCHGISELRPVSDNDSPPEYFLRFGKQKGAEGREGKAG